MWKAKDLRNTNSLKLLLCTALLYLCFAQSHAESINQLEIIKLTIPLPANAKTPKNHYIEELLKDAFEKVKTHMNNVQVGYLIPSVVYQKIEEVFPIEDWTPVSSVGVT